MKRIILWISVFACTFLNSCSTEGPSPAMVNAALVDPAAATAFWVSANGAMASCLSPAAGIIIAATAAAVGAAASAGRDRINNETPLLGTLDHDVLPSGYLLESNPFEIFGIYHNRVLQKINELGGLSAVEEGFYEWDDSTWVALLNIDTFSYSQKLDAPICGKTAIGDSLKITADFINQAESIDAVLEIIPMSQQWKDTLNDIAEKYVGLRSGGPSLTEITNYLNDEITLHLANYPETITNDEIAVVIFLTVLKHSNYYWYGAE